MHFKSNSLTKLLACFYLVSFSQVLAVIRSAEEPLSFSKKHEKVDIIELNQSQDNTGRTIFLEKFNVRLTEQNMDPDTGGKVYRLVVPVSGSLQLVGRTLTKQPGSDHIWAGGGIRILDSKGETLAEARTRLNGGPGAWIEGPYFSADYKPGEKGSYDSSCYLVAGGEYYLTASGDFVGGIPSTNTNFEISLVLFPK